MSNVPLEPEVMDEIYCSPSCPFLSRGKWSDGKCTKDNTPLHYYDWFFANCVANEEQQ